MTSVNIIIRCFSLITNTNKGQNFKNKTSISPSPVDWLIDCVDDVLRSLGMMVVSPGGAVMVTGMWMALLLRPAWLALVEFFWLSASSCFSPRLRLLRILCRGLEARQSSSASVCRSLGKQMCVLSQASLRSALGPRRAFSAK